MFFAEQKNGAPGVSCPACSNTLKNQHFLPQYPQFWQVIAFHPYEAAFPFLGKFWEKLTFYGEEMGKFFECQ